MATKRIGKQTVALETPVGVISWGNMGGKWESRGPLADGFDTLNQDGFFGQKTWEQAESAMQKTVLQTALKKGDLQWPDLDYVLAGDLLNQCIGSSFAMRDTHSPFLGLYSACATFGEGLGLGAMLVDGGYGDMVAAVASSHFCTAERQYRMPLPYGNQRTPTAQWTATAAGCCVLGKTGDKRPKITHITTGKVMDWGIKDPNNMGAAMAPAAYDTIKAHFAALGSKPQDYDLILTGDLGAFGHAIVEDLFCKDRVDMTQNYQDCGMLLYDIENQDMHAGGSGAGCSASVFCALLPQLMDGTYKRVLFAPTGALLSTLSSMQGESIPGICHAIELQIKQ